jgi:hypothetical protein
MALLARLKPYNEKKRHLTRVYMIDGARFFSERGWYEVSDALGEKLKVLHQDYHDDDSPMLFDVCTPEQAEKIDEKESAVVETKASARRPAQAEIRRRVQSLTNAESGDMTSDDVKTPKAEQPMLDPEEGKEQPPMLDPDPEGKELSEDDEDEGRAVAVGRVAPATSGRSSPPKTRVKR